MDSFQLQGKHRRHVEKVDAWSEALQRIAGPVLGFGIILAALLFGYLLIQADKDTGGIVAILSALGTLVGVFLGQRGRDTNGHDSKQLELPLEK